MGARALAWQASRAAYSESQTLEAPWRSRWVERTFATPSGEHSVDFEVSAQADARRFFCFDATSQ